MVTWRKGATEFTVSIIRNPQRHTNYSYIPKPVLERLGNPDVLKFVFRGDDILVVRPD
ncbi:MAG: hypothetical protein J4G04_04195 [Nitrosopumilaceae archaeon]|nr:hypothetical protein [Nitrosopumilaceae archaeon]